MKTKSVIVIGAGIGGLTAAIHLAKRWLHVLGTVAFVGHYRWLSSCIFRF